MLKYGMIDYDNNMDINEHDKINELKQFVNYDENNEIHSLKYQDLFVLAIAALKKMNQKVEALKLEQLKQAQIEKELAETKNELLNLKLMFYYACSKLEISTEEINLAIN